MLYYGLQIAASLVAYYHFRNNKVRYFAVITSIYFFVFFIAASFDIPLSLYLGFVLLGCGMPKRIMPKYVIIGGGIIIYSIIGFVIQDFVLTMSTLVTRFSYILVYIIVISMKDMGSEWDISDTDYRFIVRLGLLMEFMIIALVWVRHGIGARVITNNQPIGAGIIIAYTMVIGWCYMTKRFSGWEMFIYNVLSVIIVALSGTRGYMVIIALPLVVTFAMYLLDFSKNGQHMGIRIGIFCIIASFAVLWVLRSDIINVFIETLRLDEGLGYRENENIFVKKIIAEAPMYHKLFGFGFGGNASHLEGFLDIVYESSWNRPFMSVRLMTRTIFHNYWYTILFKQGFIGLLVIILFYIGVFRDVFCMKTNIWTKMLIYTTIIGNIVSLTFRITATCAIFEYLVLALFIKMADRNTRNRQLREENRLFYSKQGI